MRLFECLDCHLYYRHPIESTIENKKFYQNEYEQADGITTFLPEGADDLEKLKKSIVSDKHNPKNATRIKHIITSLFHKIESISIVDYGASWGYLSWQLSDFGARVQSYEISAPRAHFGRNLGIEIYTDTAKLTDNNDVFFSSHVIEHVPVVSEMLKKGKELIHSDGAIITICPNGSPDYRKNNPEAFHLCWGQVHPNYLNAQFFIHIYINHPLFITTSPFDLALLESWDKKSHCIGNLSGEELLVIVFPKRYKA